MADIPVIAEVMRSGFAESHHHGSVVGLDADGSVAFAIGDVTSPVFPRSCNKPIQAVGMLRAGLDLSGELLALAAASHSGEPFQIEGVRKILAGAGLDESYLQTPPDYPLDESARETQIRSGLGRTPIAMNCSGKHAAMLATCVAGGWDTAGYRDPAHPVQRQIAKTFAELTGEPVGAVGVDGCGAPLFATSLTGLARAFRRIALAPPHTHEGRVASAYRDFPEWASGSQRDEATLLRGVPGAIGKAGAEACYAVALADGRTVALKIADGGARARPVVMAAALRRLGLDAPVLEEVERVPVLGHGRPVGAVRAVGDLTASSRPVGRVTSG